MKIEFLPDGSPDCPLIRLYAFDRTEALRLREIANTLASGFQETVALHAEPRMEPIGGIELDLRLGPQDSGVVQKAQLKFECVLTKNGWDDVSFWLQPFCETETGGFQWLIDDGETSLLLSRDGKW
jgi:hypothetical protein